jgi:hypothetical protein
VGDGQVSYDVIQLVVSSRVEMLANGVIFFCFGDVVEMALEGFQNLALRLSNVLFVTCITLYAINQIVTFVTDLFSDLIFPACGIASDDAGSV